MMKVCKKCEIEKSTSQFTPRKNAKDGLQGWCKSCDAERMRARRISDPESHKAAYTKYRVNNPDKVKAMKRSYRENNPEKIKASRKLSYQNNRERDLAKQAEYKAANRELVLAKAAKYWRDNPHLNRFHRSKRRAIEKLATPSWSSSNAIMGVYAAAACLSEMSGVVYHVDHIVPLQSNLVCGLHCEDNLQILPALENISKLNRFWPDMPGVL